MKLNKMLLFIQTVITSTVLIFTSISFAAPEDTANMIADRFGYKRGGPEHKSLLQASQKGKEQGEAIARYNQAIQQQQMQQQVITLVQAALVYDAITQPKAPIQPAPSKKKQKKIRQKKDRKHSKKSSKRR